MKFIIQKYMEFFDDCTLVEKQEYKNKLLDEIEDLETDTKFDKYLFSRTNMETGHVEEYQVICFDVFALMIKEIKSQGNLIDIILYYDEPKWVVY